MRLSTLFGLVAIGALLGVVSACGSSDSDTPPATGGSAGTAAGGKAGSAQGGSGQGGSGQGGSSTGGSSTGGSSTGGSGTGGSGQGGDAGQAGASGGTSYPLPESCLKASAAFIASCNPLTNEGCGANEACDYGVDGEDEGFFCFEVSTGEEGASCDIANGPTCKAKLTCDQAEDAGSGTCKYMCCGNTDCQGTAKTCTAWDTDTLGSFGTCE